MADATAATGGHPPVSTASPPFSLARLVAFMLAVVANIVFAIGALFLGLHGVQLYFAKFVARGFHFYMVEINAVVSCGLALLAICGIVFAALLRRQRAHLLAGWWWVALAASAVSLVWTLYAASGTENLIHEYDGGDGVAHVLYFAAVATTLLAILWLVFTSLYVRSARRSWPVVPQ